MPAPVDITRIAEEHAELSRNIASYDDAPAELRDTCDLLETIERDLSVRESRMKKLIEKRKAEHKDLDKLQRSSTKRFFTRIKHGGKEGLERKLAKEEREYIEAAQNEHNENMALSELKAAAEDARTKKAELESKVSLRKEMLRKLNELYESAFDGPSPDFPEEDAAEDELHEAEVNFEHVQMRFSHEKNVLDILDQAASCANQAQLALQNANLSATYDTWQIGGAWAQMAEADDLLRAQTLAAQAHRLMQRARGLQPLVHPILPGKIVSPEWVHVVFDNMYTDFMFQQKIKQSIGSVRDYQQAIDRECTASEERVKNLTQEAKDAREFLTSRRRQLVAIRREILARIREDGGVRVFTHSSADGLADRGTDAPQLPTTCLNASSCARRKSVPPQYKADPDVPPSFPKAESIHEHLQVESLVASSFSQTREIAPRTRTNLYAPPPGPPPPSSSQFNRSSMLRMPEASFHIGPSVGTTPRSYSGNGHDDAEDSTDRLGTGSSSSSKERVNENDNGQGDQPRISFASNNPYRCL
ncbi:uncharacterized protein FOMMEDRAFT_154528 [Fomitiporia mediterranea MF3/22]|uniref:uncharacterized protein n=1 Tax=Fomitiporia mediterranea (strain MF3/22) TaxID=694068 RepID=UPI0004409AFD|nr:uncharacterized protein FOMMEDRAFT_154528 [Fomitiporia mediterranea MF3/22]EJD05295.1 hypothetical protein FOMMEDRAFT_154528 [Fomitiporia mediterranea MF3/22]